MRYVRTPRGKPYGQRWPIIPGLGAGHNTRRLDAYVRKLQKTREHRRFASWLRTRTRARQRNISHEPVIP